MGYSEYSHGVLRGLTWGTASAHMGYSEYSHAGAAVDIEVMMGRVLSVPRAARQVAVFSASGRHDWA